MPYFLTYVSAAKRQLTSEELGELLTTCRVKNASLHVTGALLYQDGNFMQVLEGDQNTVEALFKTIKLDSRHQQVIVMLRGETAEQQFSDWSMAFRDLTGAHSGLADSYSRFFSDPEHQQDGGFYPNPTVGQRLLLSFRRSLLASGR